MKKKIILTILIYFCLYTNIYAKFYYEEEEKTAKKKNLYVKIDKIKDLGILKKYLNNNNDINIRIYTIKRIIELNKEKAVEILLKHYRNLPYYPNPNAIEKPISKEKIVIIKEFIKMKTEESQEALMEIFKYYHKRTEGNQKKDIEYNVICSKILEGIANFKNLNIIKLRKILKEIYENEDETEEVRISAYRAYFTTFFKDMNIEEKIRYLIFQAGTSGEILSKEKKEYLKKLAILRIIINLEENAGPYLEKISKELPKDNPWRIIFKQQAKKRLKRD